MYFFIWEQSFVVNVNGNVPRKVCMHVTAATQTIVNQFCYITSCLNVHKGWNWCKKCSRKELLSTRINKFILIFVVRLVF